MSKKLISLILLLSISTFLTGCEEVIELTDTETRLIAEYAGELLLKNDRNYNDRIDQGEKIEKEMEEEALENPEDALSTETTESDSSETSEDAGDNDNNEDEGTNKGNELNSNIDDIDVTDDNNTDSGQQVGTESDIAKILGMNGLSITYKDYIITDHYQPDDSDEQVLSLDASEGYQLLVLRFNINNISGDSLKFTMLDEDVDYRIVCNGKNAANPMLTILLNDLGTMESVISPEECQEGVLVFQISDDMKNKLSTMELKVEYNNGENVITIL